MMPLLRQKLSTSCNFFHKVFDENLSTKIDYGKFYKECVRDL